VMMLPIPRAGILEAVGGQEAARAVPGINGLTRSQTSMRSFSRPAACAF